MIKRKNFNPPIKNIRKVAIYGGLAIILLVIALIRVPFMLQTKELKSLGYTTEEVRSIRSQRLVSTILKNDYYSENLAQAISSKTLNKKYLELYVVTDTCEEKEFLLFDRLIEKGYSKETVLSLFDGLKFYEITPLLVFDFQEDITTYLQDAQKNSESNSSAALSLTNTYRAPYEVVAPVKNEGNINMLVNKTFYLSSSYVPSKLENLSLRYASSDLQLDAEAADALEELCEGARDLGLVIYATSSYRDYEHQASLYDRYVSAKGQEEADRFSARPGHSEHQTGLTIDLSAGGESQNIGSFKDTPEFEWVKENAANYGWILRYPEGKEQITGYTYEPWHYRYIGPELAKKVAASGLTYDEYYMLYLDKPLEESK